ncbi:hypothetical protein CMI41_00380 [Candidatus Pacearchaeota archaeon]|nr:hypothetical protein [Candidatus Pacearchaeota archaeon]
MVLKNCKERFVVGFCQAATPFSAKKGIDSGLRLRAKRCFENGANFWDDDFEESACYFGGGVLGLTCAPIDAVMVAVGNVKKTLKLAA